ncbi:MAG: SDR family oxidoreductase [Candidatus Thiodiazotropha sp. (ex Lucinoma aequizonata)]|nr:SDR family oxidoreductase [Candidatus Thiodiazotropha sp. (ex Lucinoma aequizonata)]MCU7889745.1 SDR family oxidoreductase [Candidatus Thiodiazotropha sp. (ex Lucinoma aequizonata)]MCU7895133.1 SDR family oxidoreductase [Candidatus Thiodiazotropha sp. (ex Lucinoma aequizonata)]MCU7900319.1 SDR family oxidoreductase [Candidatus Thiodiazotropha sp. (ex Lucinoma aequizonata)]MCU7902067.1 SDR family oxidoreductase [Candidatus Thiodiazotropha sp. (ex Lucinoma aequizonata)]
MTTAITLRRLGCALCMPFISPFRSPFRPYNRAYAYRGLTAFAPLSMAVSVGNRGQTNYAAAKSGLHGASKSLALEVASRGITVNVVTPSIIESPMTEEHFSSELIDQLVPIKRVGKADKIADLMIFRNYSAHSAMADQIRPHVSS